MLKDYLLSQKIVSRSRLACHNHHAFVRQAASQHFVQSFDPQSKKFQAFDSNLARYLLSMQGGYFMFVAYRFSFWKPNAVPGF
jgi:hypothetical protein